jgi:hypothetical protein
MISDFGPMRATESLASDNGGRLGGRTLRPSMKQVDRGKEELAVTLLEGLCAQCTAHSETLKLGYWHSANRRRFYRGCAVQSPR